jgi:hypothetical protein
MTRSPVPSLDELVSAIESKADDPLGQLSAAVLVGQHLDDLADHLIGHFVDVARGSGASWTQIGQSLGVTKQAAQKRFVPGEPESAEVDFRIFGRYDDHARAVVVRAQQHAIRLKASAIQPGHLLLALIEDEHLNRFLGDVGDIGAIRAAVSDALGTGTGRPDASIPFSAASKKALELGHREAVRRHDEQIQPPHILLGVLAMTSEPEIAASGLDRQTVEEKLS